MLPPLMGVDKWDLDTPILCIDLDVMDANISEMAQFIQSHGVSWRPHQKCHKTPAIAQKQLAAGAIGGTCAKVSEAEVMAAGGVRDILIANMIVGQPKLQRVAALCRTADPIVACDHYVQAEALAAVCQSQGVTCRVIVEVNVGLDRVGVQPGQHTLQLAQAIDGLDGLRLAGIMGYEGHLLTVADPQQKQEQIAEAMGVLRHCRDQMIEQGLCCDIVSTSGTGSYQQSCTCEGVTEVQAGGGIFADPMYQLNMGVQGLNYALTVLATVVSRPALDRAVLDCGRKALNPDHQSAIVKDKPDAEVLRVSAEHCEIQLGEQSRDLQIGDKLELIVGYADFTTVLHDFFYGFHDNRLAAVWPILGRGKLQ